MRIKMMLAAAIMIASGLSVGGTAEAAAPYCGITWGSGDKAAGDLAQAPLLTVRTGRHDCYDRVVFEFEGAATGYRAAYGEAYTQGTGVPLSPYTAGGAVIELVLLEPAAYATGEHVATVVPYDTLRDVVAGGTSEGYTTFAIGVRARLPYRVFTLNGPGTHSRIVVDVAHQW
ncbi:hypothetical protein HDA40_006221 [Hamadaea flava]|uniref:AMIN-like domain-containing protein n=1 Tax=Hamadaea flava TaxID=1742688 RepID=A0ABV8LUL4_9ACTN|nr:hypothetical protein [Hamadaea flava]MCP2327714.1 hypothetical protein [Hamadaea flava]